MDWSSACPEWRSPPERCQFAMFIQWSHRVPGPEDIARPALHLLEDKSARYDVIMWQITRGRRTPVVIMLQSLRGQRVADAVNLFQNKMPSRGSLLRAHVMSAFTRWTKRPAHRVDQAPVAGRRDRPRHRGAYTSMSS